MKVKYKVFSNLYQDSVSLMQISAQISKLPGIQQASVVMGTPNNLEQLRDAGLGNEINASPNDLVIAVMGEEDICNEALILAQQRLTSKPDDETDSGIKTPEKVSLEMALEAEPEANLALISVPGDYAAAEAIKALNLGMNVMMFSDNVSIVQEKSIKTLARERQRIVMGPDCGTAIVNGIPLGFANVVKRGAIGVIGASGTGLQEVTCRIDQLGAGISQALGTGGHDLSKEIGGISMLFALDALAQDDETRVIVLISKPPSPIGLINWQEGHFLQYRFGVIPIMGIRHYDQFFIDYALFKNISAIADQISGFRPLFTAFYVGFLHREEGKVSG